MQTARRRVISCARRALQPDFGGLRAGLRVGSVGLPRRNAPPNRLWFVLVELVPRHEKHLLKFFKLLGNDDLWLFLKLKGRVELDWLHGGKIGQSRITAQSSALLGRVLESCGGTLQGARGKVHLLEVLLHHCDVFVVILKDFREALGALVLKSTEIFMEKGQFGSALGAKKPFKLTHLSVRLPIRVFYLRRVALQRRDNWPDRNLRQV